MEKIKETSDIWVRMQLTDISRDILELKEKLTKKRFIRNNLMLELKDRGYTYKQIAEITGCSTTMCFREILKHERLIKEWKKASSIY